MKSLIALVLALTASLTSMAELPPHTLAPAHEHLLEVNPEWNNIGILGSYTEQVQFATEAERIHFHLEAVIEWVNSNTAETSEHAPERLNLMQQLSAYAAAERFPQNINQPQRIPHFLDHQGTPCAVGHLMLENGFEAEAMLVHETINLAYIREIPSAWMASWIDYSGLNVQELALIQPGYPPSTAWTNHGGNLTGTVRAMQLWNNKLYVGGTFTIDGEAHAIGVLEGDDIVAAAFDTGGDVWDLDVFEGQLVATGTFENNNFAWIQPDTFTIDYDEVGFSKGPMGMCIEVDNGEMYMSMDAAGFIAMYAAYRWNDGEWEWLMSTDQPIWCLEVYNGDLVAGGAFTQLMDDGSAAAGLAILSDGEWSQLGNGVANTIFDLEASGDSLIIVGNFENIDDNDAFGTHVWDGSTLVTHQWNNFEIQATEDIRAARVTKMLGAHWMMGGQFTTNVGLTYGKAIAEANTFADTDALLANAEAIFNPLSGGVYDIAWVGDRLYISGDFDGNEAIVASTDAYAYLGISEPKVLDLKAWPNPTTDQLNIALPGQGTGSYVVYNATGVEVARALFSDSDQLEIAVSQWAVGSYTIVIHQSGLQGRATFVKG